MNTTRHESTQPAPLARIDGRAVAALACGVAGLFMFNIVFGPLAIGLGTSAARRARGHADRVIGLVGLLLGVADLVLLVVLVALRIHDGAFTWHLGGVR